MIPRDLLIVLVLVLAIAGPAAALEKAAAPFDDSDRPWAAGSTLTITYYNYCTGWIWYWSGWEPGARLGICAELPYSFCYPESVWMYFYTGAPAGYGFTGTVSLEAVDGNCCPVGAPLASQPLLPVSGWNQTYWGTVATPADLAVVFTVGDGINNPFSIMTDHPAIGPTGPAACGTCYPTNRVNHSFSWGTAASPLCPGSPFFDGSCNAELLFNVEAVCADWIVPESWAAVKQLYR